jgi:hypothetical protein
MLYKALLTPFVPTLDVPEGKINKILLKMPTVAALSQPVSENVGNVIKSTDFAAEKF